MKSIDSHELYELFRQFRFALNSDTGTENFMLRQGKAYQVYQAAVAHINNVHREGTEGFTKIAFGLDDVVCLQGGEAMVMKMRASAAKGRSGWNDREDCPTELLQRMLVEHVAKGDPVDVMVIANMLRHRGESTSPTIDANFSNMLMKTGDKGLEWSNESGLPG